jgi:hypothetical protein
LIYQTKQSFAGIVPGKAFPAIPLVIKLPGKGPAWRKASKIFPWL